MWLNFWNLNRAQAATPYLRLDEVVALCPDMLQESQDIDCAFIFDLLQHAVYHNVGACPAHASAVKDEGTQLGFVIFSIHGHNPSIK